MNHAHTILLVEDDQDLGYLLSEYLKMKGFGIVWKTSGKEALKSLEIQKFDLCILDIMLPEMDGYTLATSIKNGFPGTPFMFLTAKAMKIDALKGLSLGAVDYLRKPIDEEELVMRIEVLLNRFTPEESESSKLPYYKIGQHEFSPENLQLSFHGNIVQLTQRESDILLMLVQHNNQICSHKDILTKLWGKNDYFNRKSLSVFITRLRKYLAKDKTVHIENIHNQGFILKIGL
ncbi:MAG: DNA-binding response regulator [Bacteroidetes bacterium HGW-Bacteroidetes-13]|jgi:DNA-binding response OmpR family regulator|nr:MAG: DNA-binding response regulator [Bacteroidetes bacterium HGW-Bacteroidetes-13]